MSDFSANLGNWLANESTKIVGNVDTLNVLVAGARSVEEIYDLIVPLSKKLRGGMTVWSKVLAEKPAEPSGKVKFKRLDDGEWDVVLFSPYMVETSSQKSIRNDIGIALTMAKKSPSARIIVCTPKFMEASPMTLRVRLFGNAVPPTEEIKGSVSEDDLYQVLEGLGFAQLAVGRLQCKVDLSRYFKGSAEGLSEVAAWLRVQPEACRKVDAAQLRKLCEKGSEVVQQTKSVFLIPVPPGFERDARAQPSPQVWWPSGDLRTFHHYGLERWTDIRKNWENPPPDTTRRKVEKVPKMSARELNTLVETLTTNHERIELPGPMRLDDLLDVLVDVWDSLDDNA